MKKVYKANLYFLIILLLEIFMPKILLPIYDILGVTDLRIALTMNHIIFFLIPAVIYIIVTKSSVKETLKLNKLYLKDALLVILLAFLCQPIMSFFSIVTSFFFNNNIGAFITQINSTPYLIMLSLVALLPAITEEVTIRGIVLSGYVHKNKYLAAMITGLFFGILHLDPQQFLYATVLGFILALVVRITNSIFAASIIHFIINGTSVTMSKLINTIPQSTEIMNGTMDLSLRSLPFNDKLIMFVVYGVIAIIFSTFVYLILKKLEELNINRGILKEEIKSDVIR
ncbi:CPBP family intramembrane metalloprotease [Clostridium chauvoei]|uniref:CPBP family intramembrane glutamic endopeptidase n=2 Tax=Clostridium chauvoei TaxID=46867 RepID=UPI00389B718E